MRNVSRIVSVWAGALFGFAGEGEAGFNVWTTGGPPGVSFIAEVAIDPRAPTTVYAGANGSANSKGMFKSSNGGATWTPINNGLSITGFPLLTIDGLVIDPQNPSVLYVGAGPVAGVFKSGDGGASWAPSNGPRNQPGELQTTSVVEMVIDPKNPTIVYAGATNGLSKTTDGGATWARKEVGLPTNKFVQALAIDPQVPTTLYVQTQSAAGTGNVFKSSNGGDNWAPASTGLPFAAIALAVDPQNSNIVYAGLSGAPGGVAKSTNAGLTWERTSTTNLSTVVTALAIDPVHPNTVYAGTLGSGVFRTTDGGANWAAINAGLGQTGINALAISPSGTCLHAGTINAGVFDFETAPGACVPVPAAAVLPASRSVQVDTAATAFVAIANPSAVTATGCSIGLVSGIGADFSFQQTDRSTNALKGAPNTPVDIAPNDFQTFVISLTPGQSINPTDVEFRFACVNTAAAATVVGVNTLLLSASSSPTPDIVALAATVTNDGIVHIPGPNGVGFFSVATVNVGAGGSITAAVDTGGVTLPVTMTICMTNPANGQCLTANAASVTVPINASETPTFAIFVTGKGAVPFDPGVNRAFVRFKDAAGATRGATSVAVETD